MATLRRALIDRAPSAALTLLVNAQGLAYRRKRYPESMWRTLEEWRPLERFTADALRDYQLKRLRHVLRAAARTRYYSRVFREVGFNPETVTDIEDLQSLPLLERSEVITHGADMVVPKRPDRLVGKRSSGTTGEPVFYMQPRAMAYAQTYAMLYQFYAWHGFKPLGPRATLAGRYMGHRPDGVVVRNYMENQLLLGVHSLSERSVSRYLTALAVFKPHLTQAHPSALMLLRQLAEDAGLRAPNLPTVTFTGESFSEDERKSLRDWLGGAMVFGTYGSGENVVAGGECFALQGYHLHPAVGICELVDASGHQEVVGTSLLNDGMPLIRYRTGDFAGALNSSRCRCGCTWPRLESLQGRLDDMIRSTDGTLIPPVTVRTGIAALGTIKSPYSVVQRRRHGAYTLYIYARPNAESAASIESVLGYLKSVLGADSEVDFEYRSPTEMLTGRAKHRTVIAEK